MLTQSFEYHRAKYRSDEVLPLPIKTALDLCRKNAAVEMRWVELTARALFLSDDYTNREAVLRPKDEAERLVKSEVAHEVIWIEFLKDLPRDLSHGSRRKGDVLKVRKTRVEELSGGAEPNICIATEKALHRHLRRQELWRNLVENGDLNRAKTRNESHWQNDKDYVLSRLISSDTREYLDLLLGPIPLAVDDSDWSQLKLQWRQFEKLYDNYPRKATIAKHVLSAKDEKVGYVLPRPANILLAPAGSTTVFHVALELAFLLRASIEHGDSPVFPFDPCMGEWHTDSFQIAQLLARLAVNSNAPGIYLAGSGVSKNIGVNHNALKAFISPGGRSPGKIDTLVLGCNDIASDGGLYTGMPDHKMQITAYLKEPTHNVIVVASSEKIGRTGPRHLQIQYDLNYHEDANYKDVGGLVGRRRRFCIVTDKEPSIKEPPVGFAAIYWPPDGNLAASTQ